MKLMLCNMRLGLLTVLLAVGCFWNKAAAQTDEIFHGVEIKVLKTTDGGYENYIEKVLQPYNGPSYHAQSSLSSDWGGAKAIVHLPPTNKVTVNKTNERLARIGLTVTSEPRPGEFSTAEFGVEYDGNEEGSWAPFWRCGLIGGVGKATPIRWNRIDEIYTDTRDRSTRYVPKAATALITISNLLVGSLTTSPRIDSIIATIEFFDVTGLSIYNVRYTARFTSYGPFFNNTAKRPIVRLGRFAALTPNNGWEDATADTADGSTLLYGDALLTDLRLYGRNATGAVDWDVEHVWAVEHAWAVQMTNVLVVKQLASGDYFKAKMKVWYGGRCLTIHNHCADAQRYQLGKTDWTNPVIINVGPSGTWQKRIRYPAWKSDFGFHYPWFPGANASHMTVPPHGSTPTMCLTCGRPDGQCREWDLQEIMIRLLDDWVMDPAPAATMQMCVRNDAQEFHVIELKNKSAEMVYPWKNFNDSIYDTVADTCEGLQPTGKYEMATFYRLEYTPPHFHRVLQLSCPDERRHRRKLLMVQDTI